MTLNFLGIDPIRALFLSAVANGVIAAPLMFALMMVSSNSAIIGQFPLPRGLRIIGWVATAIMSLVSLGFLLSAIRGLF
jgi:Mn2+/Fe2+ NRAMP family transporter